VHRNPSCWKSLVAVVALAVVAAACGGGDDSAATDRRARERDPDATTTTVTEVAGIDDVPAADQDDAIIEVTLQEVEAFWADQFPDVYDDTFEPVSGGFFPYGPDRDPVPCGTPPPRYDDIAQNAFYCPQGDLIAWDTDNLTNDLLDRFGPFSLVIVVAHEYGHAIQERVPVRGPTIETEQQADCFAGAFAKFVADGGSDQLAVSLDDLDNAVAGFLTLRDQVGTPSTDPQAHGSAFDRVGAFQDGYANGVDRCAQYQRIYDQGGTTVVDIPFFTQEDLASGGNAPFDPNVDSNIFDLTLRSLEGFWTDALPAQFDETWRPLAPDHIEAYTSDPETLPDCPGVDASPADLQGQAFFCFGDPDDPNDDFVAFDIENLMAPLYDQIGDFAVAGVIAQQYSFAVQSQLDIAEDSIDSSLQADCFTGAWAGEVAQETLNQTGDVALSPGDLDEAIQSFLLLADQERAGDTGTPFQRVTSFRDGFFNGLDQCATYLDGGAPAEDSPVAQGD
jgi:predicted metalloprotease